MQKHKIKIFSFSFVKLPTSDDHDCPSHTKMLNIMIQYCGGWGYGRHSRALKDFLDKEFHDLIRVNERMDRGVTGNFEVTIVETGKLIHSKSRGEGFADTAQVRQSIVGQIKEALGAV